MKCHICQKEIILDKYWEDADALWSCPEGHVEFQLNQEGKVVKYTLYWDEDDQAHIRYKIIYNNHDHKTKLSKKVSHKYYRGFLYQEIMTIDGYFEIPIKEDQIQADNLIPRLLRLKAFS